MTLTPGTGLPTADSYASVTAADARNAALGVVDRRLGVEMSYLSTHRFPRTD